MRKKTETQHKLSGNASRLTKAELAKRKAALTIVPKVQKVGNTTIPTDLDEIGARKFRELLAEQIFDNNESASHYARLFQQKAEADADIRARGMTIEGERGTKANPSVRLSSDLAKELTKMLAQRAKAQGAADNAGLQLIQGAIEKLRATR